MTLSQNPYKGTRDYYPHHKAVQNYVFNKWREVVQSFGYKEYGVPLLEPVELYRAKSGNELASEQAYSFKDKGGREVAIRPEATPSVSRLVAGRRQDFAYPARLFSIANYMRYERPQKGREREFWQLNIDMFGGDGVAADAETIWLAEKLLTSLGATSEHFTILVNHRGLLSDLLTQFVGLSDEQIKPLIKLIDNKSKISPNEFKRGVNEIISDDEKQGRFNKIISTTSLSQLEKIVGQNENLSQLKELFKILQQLNVTSAQFDITLVRGLDYYTGTVFEVIDHHPENNRSIFGGGRYDGLVEMFGVEPISAVGFAPGYTTTELFLKTHNLLPQTFPGIDIYIATLDNEVLASYQLAEKLREKGYKVDVDISHRKLDKKIKSANKKDAKYLAVIGSDEAKSKTYSLKNLKTGKQQSISSFN